MILDTSNVPPPRMNAAHELKFTRPETDLYVGQILKTVVIKEISNNQVLININGENINAQTAHKLNVGDKFAMQVVSSTKDEVILKPYILPSQSHIEMALAKELPRQAPATHLFTSLTFLQQSEKIPENVHQAIQNLLNSFVSISELSAKFAEALAQSGFFWEKIALDKKNKKKMMDKNFKKLCSNLLKSLIKEGAKKKAFHQSNDYFEANLPCGEMPKPLDKSFDASILADLNSSELLDILRNQTEEVLARIKTEQLLHLTKENNNEYCFDLPVKTNFGFDVIPISISPTTQNGWSIGLAINLTHLGAIQIRIKMIEKTVDIQLNFKEQQSLNLIADSQDIIDGLLTNLNLTLRSFHLNLGIDEPSSNQNNFRLLDIRI